MRRVFWALPAAIVATVGYATVACLIGLADRRRAHALTRPWARLVLRLAGIEVELRGVACQEPAVYAANHVSLLDIPILFAVLPVDFRIIHKRSLSAVPLIGWFLTLSGHIAIDRSNPFRARRSLNLAAQRIAAGTSVVVFPEGTRRGSAGLGLFKRGSFVLAIEAGVPVVPVSLSGVGRLTPAGLFSLRPGAVLVDLHAALATRGTPVGEAELLAERARAVVANALALPEAS